MLPPRPFRSPRQPSNQVFTQSDDVPIPNNRRKSQQKQRVSQNFRLNAVSRVQKYSHFHSGKQKHKQLTRVKYINQLAQLDFQERFMQIQTKYSMVSKVSAMKKIKAKNQIAQFAQDQDQQQVGFEELMEYKYGPHNNEGQMFHFEKEEVQQYEFCQKCDFIHNDHSEVHQIVCNERILAIRTSNQGLPQCYNPDSQEYQMSCLNRLGKITERMNAQEYEELTRIIKKLKESEQQKISNKLPKHLHMANLDQHFRQLNELHRINQKDPIFSGILKKIQLIYKK